MHRTEATSDQRLSSSICSAAAKLGIECTEDDLDLFDAYNADEAFIASTSLCICPVASINGVKMPAGAYGPVTQKLIDAYVDLVECDFVQQYLDRFSS